MREREGSVKGGAGKTVAGRRGEIQQCEGRNITVLEETREMKEITAKKNKASCQEVMDETRAGLIKQTRLNH